MIKGWERKVPPPQSEKMEGMLGTWKMGRGDGVRSVPDGSSNTLMLSEVIGYDSIYDNRGAWVHNSPGSTVFTGYTTPNSTTPDMIPLCYESTDDGGGGIPEADIRHCTENRRDGDIWAAARSRHPGGVNVARADSSLAFVTDSVDPGVWKAMCTIDGPENEPNLLGNW